MGDQSDEIQQQQKEQKQKEAAGLSQKYQEKGLQSITLSEYAALKAKQAKQREKKGVPKAVKIILLTPFLLIFAAGVFYIPYSIFVIVTNPYVGHTPSASTPKKDTKKQLEELKKDYSKNKINKK